MTTDDKVAELRQQLPEGWVIVPRYWVLDYAEYYPGAWNVHSTTPSKDTADARATAIDHGRHIGEVVDLLQDVPEVLNGDTP